MMGTDWVAIAVDEERFPFAFVLIEGTARIEALAPSELLPYSTRTAARYVGDERADAYGRRNAVEGEVRGPVVERLTGPGVLRRAGEWRLSNAQRALLRAGRLIVAGYSAEGAVSVRLRLP